MANEFYSKGTIKVKNADGVLVPFLPVTDFSCISDQSNAALPQIISNMETEIAEAENSGGVELLYEEPDADNTAGFNAETMIAWLDCSEVPNDTWQYVVDTREYAYGGHSNKTNATTAVPFNLYGMPSITITVDWGDGTTSTLTSADYTEHNTNASMHTYDQPGQYIVQVKSSDWSNTYFSTLKAYSWIDAPAWNEKFNFIVYFRETLKYLDTPIPAIKGMKFWTSQNGSRTTQQNSLTYLFWECKNLRRVNPNIFSNCVNVTDFSSCFTACLKLETIPKNLFKNNVNATNFSSCFSSGYAIQSIPEELFRYNTEATNFTECFEFCTKIKSVPENLFKYNSAANDFTECFEYVPLTSIPENLFKYNTAATKFNYCFHGCTGLKAIPENLFRYNIQATNFNSCFFECSRLETVPENLFRYNAAADSFSWCFGRCTALTEIPSNLFKYSTAATKFSYCLYGCTNLTGFELHIGSSAVNDIDEFSASVNGTKTVYVPSGSTTEATFNNASSNLGLTVIGE